jgi:hypothetical protein
MHGVWGLSILDKGGAVQSAGMGVEVEQDFNTALRHIISTGVKNDDLLALSNCALICHHR